MAEYEAILAYHLDQAHGFRAELGQHGETVDRLAERAGQHYLVAARQADDRNDAVSGRPLLERAVALVKPGTGRWLDAVIDLGVTLGNLGELTLADDRFEQALASIDIEPIQRAKARIQRAGLGAQTRRASWAVSLERAVRDELPTLERAGDQEALAEAYQMLSYVLGETDRRQQAFEAMTKALGHARASGVRGTQVVMAGDFAAVAVRALPPREARKAIAESIADDDVDGGARAGLLNGLGWLAALDGDLEDGRSKMEEAIRIADALSMVTLMTNFRVEAGRIAMWAGDPASARTSFRAAMEIALAHGLATDVLEAKAWLASALLALADDDGAASLAAEVIDQRGLEWAVDVPSMRVQGRLLARRGNVAAGRAVMQDAWEVASRAGSNVSRIEVAVDEIQLLLEAGLREDAELAAARARQLLTGYPSVQLLRMIDDAANAGR